MPKGADRSKRARVSTPPASRPGLLSGPEILRRLGLVLVISLLVARPTVLGEDPGLLADASDPGSMVLTVLWMVAALIWAVWHLWTREERWPFTRIEGLFLATVLCIFISAELAASYHHPARLIAWEWVGLLLTLVVVRLFARRPRERHGLFTALLATGVAIAAHGVYQKVIELPRMREAYTQGSLTNLNRAMVPLEAEVSSEELAGIRQRIEEGHAFGPFAHPNSFAGVLSLLLPGVIVAAGLAWRNRYPLWALVVVVGCAFLVVLALWQTHSRGALLASVVVGVVAGVLAGRAWLLAHKALAVVACLVLAGGAALVFFTGALDTALGKTSTTATSRLVYWSATAKMIADHPWLGVGPGNFGAMYTRYMPAPDQVPAGTTGEQIKDPHNLVLEIWSNAGLFALIALLAALATLGIRVVRWYREEAGVGAGSVSDGPVRAGSVSDGIVRAGSVSDGPVRAGSVSDGPSRRTPKTVAHASGSDGGPSPDDSGSVALSPRWEFYIGGGTGLLLGFLLRAMGMPGEGILDEALTAICRVVVWFLAFGVMERLVWSPRVRVGVLCAGVSALLLNLLVSGGIGFPSVACLLWAAVALILSDLEATFGTAPAPSRGGGGLQLLPLPVLIAVLGTYFLFVFVPVSSASSEINQAMTAARYYLQRKEKILDPQAYLRNQVIDPLQRAASYDRDNAHIAVLLARWYGWLWTESRFRQEDEDDGKKALLSAQEGQRLNPEGRQPYQVEYELRRLFANVSGLQAQRIREELKKKEVKGQQRQVLEEQASRLEENHLRHYREAAKVMRAYLPRDPTDPTVHAQLANALHESGEPGWEEPARQALRLDASASRFRKLADPMRAQLKKWLDVVSGE